MISIVSINNVTIDRAKYHPGYIITDRSIIIGLTSNNTQGFVTMDLEKGPNWEKDQRAWAGPKVSVALNNDLCDRLPGFSSGRYWCYTDVFKDRGAVSTGWRDQICDSG